MTGVAVRQHSRVTLLISTVPTHGEVRFHRKLAQIRRRRASSDPADFEDIDLNFEDMNQRILRVTERQRDDALFLTRKFRVTSSVASQCYRAFLKTSDDSGDSDLVMATATRDTLKVLGYRLLRHDVPPTGPESERETKMNDLMKLKKHVLVDICKINNITASGNKPDLAARKVDKNINTDVVQDDETPKSMEQLLHDAWFMRPLRKGRGESDAVRKCTVNEERVLEWLPSFMRDNSDLKVTGVKEFGLLAVNHKPWMATSVDGVAVLERRINDAEFESSIPTSPFIACVEIKTRTGGRARREISNIAAGMGTSKLKWFEVDVDNERSVKKFKRYVPNRDYRHQVLHHCVVTGIPHALYLETTMTGITYSVLIKFCGNVLSSCELSMEAIIVPKLKTFHQHGMEDDIAPISEEYAKLINPGWAVDLDTYNLTFCLWLNLEKQIIEKGEPLSATHRILAGMQSWWNRLKGGVDVFSRLLKNLKPTHQGMNLHQVVHFRGLFTALAQCHVLSRGLIPLKKYRSGRTLFAQRFKSYEDWKDRLNKKSSFKTGLLMILDLLDTLEKPGFDEECFSSPDIATDSGEKKFV